MIQRSAPPLASALPGQTGLDGTVEQEQARLLVTILPLSSGVSMFMALLLAYAMTGPVSAPRIMGWLAAMLVVCCARMALWHAYRSRMFPEMATRDWLRILAAAAFAAGLVWGSAAFWIFPTESLAHQFFMGVVLASMASGGMTTLGVHFVSYVAFLVPTLMPFALRLIAEGGELQMFMAIIFLLGQGFLSVSARRFSAVTIDGLTLHFENGRLVVALREALKCAEESSVAKTQFLANMSHEIRTPLSGILGMSELLRKTDLTAHQSKLAGTMTRSAKSLLSLVEDVLDISRIETGKFTLERHPFSLRQCVEDAVEMCAGAGYAKGLEIHLVPNGRLPIEVMGDAARLRQIMINLMGNAIKFTEAGQIIVRVRVEPGNGKSLAATFAVSDTGIGIAPHDVEKLFTPFTQADASTQRRFGGTGLGLAITRHLVDQMGGEMKLDSELGKGTSVSFTIPLDGVTDGEIAFEAPPEALDGRRILILDDRQTSREAISSAIAHPSALIESATSDTDALMKLRRAVEAGEPFDVLVVDRIRPRTECITFLHRIRSSRDLARLDVVALMPSAWEGSAALQRGLSPCTFLNKPVRRLELVAAIASVGAKRDLHASTPVEPVLMVSNTAAAPAAAAAIVAPAGSPAEPLQGLRVLVAEDNPVNQEVALAFLEGFGCSPTLAGNGIEAIDANSKSTFDMILMDCQMPQLDGLAAIRQIRSSERTAGSSRIPIIMVTANAFDSDRIDALAAGADDFLSKPYNEAQLDKVMRENLEAARRRERAAA